MKKLRSLFIWNAAVHLSFVAEKDDLIENLNSAKPIDALNQWELNEMYKYDDCPNRWDDEIGWKWVNNDSV